MYVADLTALEVMEFCDARVDFAETNATWLSSIAIKENLDEHHELASMEYMEIEAFLGEFQTLTVRMNIEENLQQDGNRRVSLFQIPAIRGGYLDTTRDIVTETIIQNLSAGMPVGNAAAELAAGNSLFAQFKWKDAYGRYRNAYRAAVGGNPTVP